MSIHPPPFEISDSQAGPPLESTHWAGNGILIWSQRRKVLRATVFAAIISGIIVFVIPKQYESWVRIMPPEQPGGVALMAALAGRSLPPNFGALASTLFGIRNSSALFAELLQSRSVREGLVDRFDLQKVYSKRYRQDAIKKVGKRTEITEDRKTGIITVVVTDTDRQRARDMAQAYLDELNSLLAKVNTSSARRERQFIEQRLVDVKRDLDDAQLQLSAFSSKNTTLDVKEQTRAMVEAGAKLQGELIVAKSEVTSLQQFYSDDNVRVRAARARVSELQRALTRATGSDSPAPPGAEIADDSPYPSLRAMPALGVQWANLYRRVTIQETIFNLLTAEYETARIEEAKSIPTVSVIDPPNWPEKKSFPPRLILILVCTLLATIGTSIYIVLRERWSAVSGTDPRKELANQLRRTLLSRASWRFQSWKT